MNNTKFTEEQNKKQKFNSLLYNTSLFIFVFNMINREFKLFNVIDLRVLFLTTSSLLLCLNLKQLVSSFKDKGRFFRLVIFFYLYTFMSNMLNFIFRRMNFELNIFLNLNFLYLYGFISFIALVIFSNYFQIKNLLYYFAVSMMFLAFSMFYSYSYHNLDAIWANIPGIFKNERMKNFWGSNYRLSGYAQDPNYTSFSIAIVSVFIYYTTCIEQRKKYLIIFVLGFLYMFSASKSVLLGLIFLIITKIITKVFVKKIPSPKKTLRKLYLFNFITILFALFALTLLNGNIIDWTILGSSMNQRITMWKSSVNLFLKSPLIGSGLGSARNYYKITGGRSVQIHNAYLQTLAEGGLIGFVLLVKISKTMTLSKDKIINSLGILLVFLSMTYETVYLAFFPFVLICFENINSINKQRQHSIYFVNSLKKGGAEKVVLDLITHDDNEVVVFTTDKVDDGDIPRGSTIYHVPLDSIFNIIKSIHIVNSYFYNLNPNEVSFITAHLLRAHLLASISIARKKTLYVFHSTLNSYNRSLLRDIIYRLIYFNKNITMLSNWIAHEFLDDLKIRPKKISFIENPIDFDKISSTIRNLNRVSSISDRKYVLFCGRLEKIKRPELFIEVYYDLNLFDEYDAIILGDGSLKESLVSKVSNLGISQQVKFCGYVPNPYDFFHESELLIMTSEYESSGLVLLEALYSGTKVVSYDCDFGPREILIGPLSKYLVRKNEISNWKRTIKSALVDEIEEVDLEPIFKNRDIDSSLNLLKNINKGVL